LHLPGAGHDRTARPPGGSDHTGLTNGLDECLNCHDNIVCGQAYRPSSSQQCCFQFLFVALYGACDEQEFKIEPTPPSWPLRALAYKSKETQFLKLFSDDVKLEFLFLVLHHEDDQNWHIATYLFALSTSPQSNSRMTIFIR